MLFRSLEFTRRTGCPVHAVWGMTELAGATSANPIYGINKPGSIGLPYPGNSFRVVDADNATREMPRGQPGELMFHGPLVPSDAAHVCERRCSASLSSVW